MERARPVGVPERRNGGADGLVGPRGEVNGEEDSISERKKEGAGADEDIDDGVEESEEGADVAAGSD